MRFIPLNIFFGNGEPAATYVASTLHYRIKYLMKIFFFVVHNLNYLINKYDMVLSISNYLLISKLPQLILCLFDGIIKKGFYYFLI